MIQIRECRIARPINSLSGLYVQLKGTYQELSTTGKDKAKQLANKEGFDPNGRAEDGFPVSFGLDTYTKAYWFFDKVN